MKQAQKAPWESPKLKPLDVSEDILDRLAPEAKTPEQRRRIEELRKELERNSRL